MINIILLLYYTIIYYYYIILHPLRQVSFEPGTYTAATSRYLRRVGRPRKEWIPEVFSLALSFTGSTRNLLFFVQNEKQWRQLVLNQ